MDWAAFLSSTKEFSEALIRLLATAACVLVGLWMIFSAFVKMIQHAQGLRHGQPTAGPVAINLVIGALMLQLSSTAQSMVNMLFGADMQAPSNALNYMPPELAGSEVMQQAIAVAVYWVAAIGWVAAFRGLLLWNDLSKGQSSSTQDAGWRGLVHILGGAAAINIGGFVQSIFG